ncbi:MAG: dihydrodipicolinate synthase family protein [SAR202 cluster bacterium]|nr:dihydrodipicolinate synthase family protein [SAR202 cluster bacterium]
MSKKVFEGVMVPTLTPVKEDETVAVVSTRKLVQYLIGKGVHGFWAAGTTGEFANLSDEQRVLSITTIVEETRGRVPVIANISAASTMQAVKIAKMLKGSGVDGIAATPPYYYPSGQDELLTHYRYIKQNSDVPLWVYNIPSTVKTTVEPATMATLAAEGTCIGTKDSSTAGEALALLNVLIEEKGLTFHRYLGSTHRTATARALGGCGVIPGLANVYADFFVKAWQAGEKGDKEAAKKFHGLLVKGGKLQAIAKGGSPNSAIIGGQKAALKMMGVIDSDCVTRPFRSLTDDERKQLATLLKELGLM